MRRTDREMNLMAEISDDDLELVAGGSFRRSSDDDRSTKTYTCVCKWSGTSAQLKRGGLCPNCGAKLGER